MADPATYTKIQKWMSINRPMLQEIYHRFLNIYNIKYDLNLKNTKTLYHDFCIHLYYTYEDNYGFTLFETQEEKNAYYARYRKPQEYVSSSSSSSSHSTEDMEENDMLEEIEFEEEEE
jgi:hypothetical protein